MYLYPAPGINKTLHAYICMLSALNITGDIVRQNKTHIFTSLRMRYPQFYRVIEVCHTFMHIDYKDDDTRRRLCQGHYLQLGCLTIKKDQYPL